MSLRHRLPTTKLHNKLLERSRYYRGWHNYPHHRRIHYSVLGIYLAAIVGLVVGTLYPVGNFAQAASANWDFSTSANYIYDSSKIEFVGGIAQLKAGGTPGTTWIANEGGATWSYRRQITIDITGNSSIASGYVVSGSFSGTDASAIFTASLGSGNDFRVIYYDGANSNNVMRDLVTFNSSTINFYFKTQAELATNDSTHYFVYYGNSLASAPTVDKTQIYNNTTNAALSAAGSTATVSDFYGGNVATLMNDGFADKDHNGWGNSAIANSRAMIKLSANRRIWKVVQYWGGNNSGNWGMPAGTYFPSTYQVQYSTDGSAVVGDVVGSAKWTSLSTTANGLTISRIDTTDYINPGYGGAPTVSGTTNTTNFTGCTNCWDTSIVNTFNPISSLSARYAYVNAGYLGTMGEFYVYPINATDATAEPTLAFGSATNMFDTSNPTIVPTIGQGYSSVSAFAQTLGGSSSGNVKYQISSNDGSTWYWYTGGAWTVTSSGYTESNTAASINSNISSFTVGSSPKTFKWRAYLNSSGSQQPQIDSLGLTYVWDSLAPDNPGSVTALSQLGGSALTTNTWYGYSGPYFSWSEPNDNADTGNGEVLSGIAGYYLYFGTDNTAVPCTTGNYQTARNYTASSLTSTQTYYLRFQTKDNAGNISKDPGFVGDATVCTNSGISQLFIYKYDGINPSNPSYLTASPSTFSKTKDFTFSWPTSGGTQASDSGGSGLKGYQYRINGDTNWYGADRTGGLDDVILAATSSYQLVSADQDLVSEGTNIFYFRTLDNAHNISSSAVQVPFYYNASAPSAPTNLTILPSSSLISPSATNSFSVSWNLPISYQGTIASYHYSINIPPDQNSWTTTLNTSLAAGPYATKQGKNTFYIIAEDNAGNFNTSDYASADFYVQTPAPGIPLNLTLVDTSIRDQSYKVTASWTEPTDKGVGFSGYNIYRSADGATYVKLSEIGDSTAYIDTNLAANTTYYYKVRARDSAGKESADSDAKSVKATGRWTTPAPITRQPSVTAKAFQATINWQTDPTSDHKGSSFVELGKTQDLGLTFGQLDNVAEHSVAILGLEPETTYYYIAKSIDQDGNIAASDLLTFATTARPRISKVEFIDVRKTTLIIRWETSVLMTTEVAYGATLNYGGYYKEGDTPNSTKHTVVLDSLTPDTAYNFQIKGKDDEGNNVVSDNYLTRTLPYPYITNVTFQPLTSEATTTVEISWTTNVPTTSVVNFAPEGSSTVAEQSSGDYTTEHKVKVGNGLLGDNAKYQFTTTGRDKFGDEATQSDGKKRQDSFMTPFDTRPPKVSDISVETQMDGYGVTTAKAIVSWTTDEPSSSQVQYAVGLGSGDYSSSSSEDAALTTSHVVVVPELKTASTYHMRVLSKDKAGNSATSQATNFITGQSSQSVIDIIIGQLKSVLGWIPFLGGGQ